MSTSARARLTSLTIVALWGCGGSDTPDTIETTDTGTIFRDLGPQTDDDAGVADDTGSTPQWPPVPALGAQIDRAGRAIVNIVLIAPMADTATQARMRDQYNAAAPGDWDTFTATITASLALYDAFDGLCGNQLMIAAGATSTIAGAYDRLGQTLADDRLYVNTSTGTCDEYLGVELDATNVSANDDCGGRSPRYDVVDSLYAMMAGTSTAAVTDGISADDRSHSDAVFPYLAAP